MARYVIKLFVYIIPTIIVLTFVVFGILALTPADPVYAIVGPNATVQEIEAMREELGLNDNVFLRFGKYMFNMVQGDFGVSWVRGNNISAELFSRLGNTLILSAFALVLTVIIGMPLGVIAAVYQYRTIDKITLFVALFLVSIPGFFLALICQLLFALHLGWLPVSGAESFMHFVLPAFMLAAAQIAIQVRMTRSSMLDVISQDYIRTAYAKGCSKRRAILHHALRNGLLPVVTGIGNNVGRLVSGAAVIEIIFSIPGLSAMIINGVRTMDVPVVMGPVIISSLIICAVNVFTDIIYAFIDPRVKMRFSNWR